MVVRERKKFHLGFSFSACLECTHDWLGVGYRISTIEYRISSTLLPPEGPILSFTEFWCTHMCPWGAQAHECAYTSQRTKTR